MPISDTSFIAYSKALPQMPKSRRIVFETILAHPEGLTNAEIAYYTKKTINRITGRTFELRQAGLIYDSGVRDCRVNHTAAHAWKVKPAQLPPAREIPPEPQKESNTNQQQLL